MERLRALGERREEEGGQVLPVLLVAFVAVLAVGLVLFQVGSATDDKAQAQTAADAAALAGAKSIGVSIERKLNGLTGPLAPLALASLLSGISGEGAARSYAEANGATMPPGGFTVVLAPKIDPTTGVIVLTVEATVLSNAAVPPPKPGRSATPSNGSPGGMDAGSGEHATATAWAELDLVPSSGGDLLTAPPSVSTTVGGGPVPSVGPPPTPLGLTGRTRLVAAPAGFVPAPLG